MQGTSFAWDGLRRNKNLVSALNDGNRARSQVQRCNAILANEYDAALGRSRIMSRQVERSLWNEFYLKGEV